MASRARLPLALVALAALLSACGGGGTSGSGEATAIAFKCPRAEFPEGSIGRHNANSHADEATVPGRPDRVLVCRYFGLNQGPRPEKLAASRSVSARDGDQLEAIAAE